MQGGCDCIVVGRRTSAPEENRICVCQPACAHMAKVHKPGSKHAVSQGLRGCAGTWKVSLGLKQKGPSANSSHHLHNTQKTCGTVHSSHRHMPDVCYLSRNVLIPPNSYQAWSSCLIGLSTPEALTECLLQKETR